MHPDRVRFLKKGPWGDGPVIYWMSRDQRSRDNWALWYAQATALEKRSPLLVVFCLVPDFLGATKRQYTFMIKGLQEVEQSLREKNIPFYCLMGDPGKLRFPNGSGRSRLSCLITDFDPLRIKRSWKEEITKAIEIPFLEVDAHNIVPCWTASPKQEFGAYTLRPKIHRRLDEFLEEIPPLKKHPFTWGGKNSPDRLDGYPEKPENRFYGTGGGLVETRRKGRRGAAFNSFYKTSFLFMMKNETTPIKKVNPIYPLIFISDSYRPKGLPWKYEKNQKTLNQKGPSWRN